MQLASKPALERLREAIEELEPDERDLAAEGLLLGVVIDENQPDYVRGDFLVRPIVGVDPDSGALAFADRVRVGQTVRLHVRDAGSASDDLRDALAARVEALGAGGAAGALLFTCNGRGIHMFAQPDHDAALVDAELEAPAGGFFCAGEIGPVGGRNFLHGFTATMAVFPRD
jgi:small ligand-binding sensory domain FIST